MEYLKKIMKAVSWQVVSKYIGVELSNLRKKKGFSTVKDFALKYRLPEIQYWRMKKGKANLTLKSLDQNIGNSQNSGRRFFL